MIQRRFFFLSALAALLWRSAGSATPAPLPESPPTMYGLISKLKTISGKRDALIDILLDGTRDMPGCRIYTVSRDQADEDGVWIHEVWTSEDHHRAALQLPEVQQALAAGKPLIAGFEARHAVTPVGGVGID